MQEFNVVNLADMDDYVIGTPIRRGKMQVTIRQRGARPASISGAPEEVEAVLDSAVKFVAIARVHGEESAG